MFESLKIFKILPTKIFSLLPLLPPSYPQVHEQNQAKLEVENMPVSQISETRDFSFDKNILQSKMNG